MITPVVFGRCYFYGKIQKESDEKPGHHQKADIKIEKLSEEENELLDSVDMFLGN